MNSISIIPQEVGAVAVAAPTGGILAHPSPCPSDRSTNSDNNYQSTFPVITHPRANTPSKYRTGSLPIYRPNSYEWKVQAAAKANIHRFINEVGIQRVAVICLTFPKKKYVSREAMRCFNNLTRRVLKLFGPWGRILERHKDGSFHIHLLVDMGQDILTGFDIKAYYALEGEFEKAITFGQRYRILCQCTTEGHPLRKIWVDLNPRFKAHGYGRFDLFPIRSDAEKISIYVTKSIAMNMAASREFAAKCKLVAMRETPPRVHVAPLRVQYVRYSENFKLSYGPRFNWNDKFSKDCREQVAVFAERLGCKDPDEVSKLLCNKKWQRDYRDLIKSLHIPSDVCPEYLNGVNGAWALGPPPPLATYDDLHIAGDFVEAYPGCDPSVPRLIGFDWRAKNETLFQAAYRKLSIALLPADTMAAWRAQWARGTSILPPGFPAPRRNRHGSIIK